jgi:plastocyanin/6-phosphogluconolactonase (cycloisomerase 2 family)
MNKRILLALLCMLSGWGMAGMAQAAATVTFDAQDAPGSWFKCSGSGCVPETVPGMSGQQSLAVIHPGDSVGFTSTGQANTIHTAVSLMFPTGAAGMPFDVDLETPTHGMPAPEPVTLTIPGLYVFFCDIHVYMFAAVIVDDPLTPELDLGKTVDLPSVTTNGIARLPTYSNLALRLVHTFFIYTNPNNWQYYSAKDQKNGWDPQYPQVPVLAYDKDGKPVSITNLNTAMRTAFGEPKDLLAPVPPSAPGVGQVWVDTQFERMNEKSKPGTATAVNATTFQVERKVGLPSINMNNPHNMWTDKDQRVIYQTQWFDENLAVFDRKTGHLRYNLPAGPAPAHVMTRTSNDYVHVSANGDNYVKEFNNLAHHNAPIREIQMQTGECCAHPHGHFMSADGQMMVTPNEDAEATALYDFTYGLAKPAPTGHSPIATGMMPDSSKYYVANFLDNTLSVIGITQHHGHAPTIKKLYDINLLGNYNPIDGTSSGFIGALPIQTPVSPDGRFVITANALTSTILVIETKTDKVVASLLCDAGCHGIQFGAKQGGGYYAYVSSKFSNRMLVIDPDPNGVGHAPDNGSNAIIVGSVLLTTANKSSHFEMDGHISSKDNEAYSGMGGQGVLPIPLVYNGWVQNLPDEWKEKLTYQQKHPFPGHDDHQ